MRRNNAPEGQTAQEQAAQSQPPPPADQSKVADVDKLNKSIAELTEKNNELLVSHKLVKIT